jgi:flagellar protein FliO/FliZ
MSTTFNAAIALLGTLTAFALLAALVKAVRQRQWGFSLRGLSAPPISRRLGIEEVCAVDPRRRLVLIRCGEQRFLLMTGGPADLVVATLTDAAGACP